MSHEAVPDPDSVFLDPTNSMCALDGSEPWMSPSPPRTGCKVTPLIEAADMYPTLEHLMLDAERSVWLSFRIFDPDTKLRSPRAREAGLDSWADLIRHAVKRGVEVRILLADFEPVLADYLHAGSWHTFRTIRRIVEELDEADRARLQLIVIQHEGEIGRGWRFLMKPLLHTRLKEVVTRLIDGAADEDGGLDTRPGLWRFVSWQKDKAAGFRSGAPARLWPATYHQKFVVIDGIRAIIGGLDLDERRWDDRRHRQRTNETWHDISALIEGPVVADAARHFAFLWNREIPRYRTIIREWTDGGDRALMVDPLLDAPAPEAEPAPAGDATVQLARTLSVRSDHPFAIGPRHAVRELKAAHRSLIGSARRLLYIEAQFFRSREAADWVVEALERQPELQVIILIANTPEEVAFEGQGDNPAHRHGEYLQARALKRILDTGGPSRVGLFSLAKQEAVKGNEEKFEETRGTAYGSGLIHIHSKLLIADDRLCLLSSANINGRSFDWDTEFGFLWREEGRAIADFRCRLWGQLIEEVPADLDGWRDIARHNAGAEPSARKGFVVPYQLGRARRYSRPVVFIPDDLV